ncbi:MAG: hypothetical protein IJV35_04465 [Neisseriaceae bacterium]|nr:hypothetical protein [Neisseriaceae bacterium]
MQFIGLPRRDFVSARNDTVFNILKLFDYIFSGCLKQNRSVILNISVKPDKA